MLDAVKIKNFQSHEASELQFSPGVNVIIGPSDAGKSAVFRALIWGISNRPLGDAFRSEWGGETRVVLRTTDNITVERTKDKNKNSYFVNGTELKAFGSDPPESVQEALLMDEVNIQNQTDPPFLFVNSPGEVAQMLNKAASIDDIDRAINGLRRGLTHLRQSIKQKEEQLQKQKEEIKQYKDLPALESKIEELETLEKKEQELYRSSVRLERQLNSAKNLREEIDNTKDTKKPLQLIAETQELNINRSAIAKQFRRFSHLIKDAIRKQQEINKIQDKISILQNQYNQLAPKICPLCNGTGDARRGI